MMAVKSSLGESRTAANNRTAHKYSVNDQADKKVTA
jgi:hypothetical protein